MSKTVSTRRGKKNPTDSMNQNSIFQLTVNQVLFLIPLARTEYRLASFLHGKLLCEITHEFTRQSQDCNVVECWHLVLIEFPTSSLNFLRLLLRKLSTKWRILSSKYGYGNCKDGSKLDLRSSNVSLQIFEQFLHDHCSLCWFFWLVLTHPNVDTKILEEIRVNFKIDKEDLLILGVEDLNKLIYLHGNHVPSSVPSNLIHLVVEIMLTQILWCITPYTQWEEWNKYGEKIAWNLSLKSGF
ncbi:hypothetical protein Ahy_A03g016459 [Arachis hypogaea]|uniref:Uncharacterized protein n=1 Tax=Arachis hypogaea TaxID=3818 RepID=A0A445E3B8_ARAHY|nr:hypothetical protein Ahy_A03g016459 [Arachis hypogaea]